MPSSEVCFLVTSSEQLRDALAVSGRLDRSKCAWNAYADEPVGLDGATRELKRIVSPGYEAAWGSARRVGRWARSGGRVLVLGQDVGLAERAAIASARRANASVVLLPDGVISRGRSSPNGSFETLKRTADVILERAGLLSGRRARFGASDPDAIASWGAGWDRDWRAAAPAARICDTGSPRMDRLAGIPSPGDERRMLVCSQPMTLLCRPGSNAIRDWYQWLERVAEGGDDTRVRLHPVERRLIASGELEVGSALQGRAGDNPLEDDLAWASAVAAPISTAMVEAAAAGRPVISVRPYELSDLARRCAFFADRRVPVMASRPDLSVDELWAAAQAGGEEQAALKERYATNVGHASSACAALVEEVAA